MYLCAPRNHPKRKDSVKIGNIELPKEPLLLAPMEDVSDHMFRSICKSHGADLMYTEFVSSDALVRDVEKTKRKLTLLEDERPIGIQLYGKDPQALADAAQIAEQYNPDIIDLNFGCPVKKIATKGAGSGLLQNIPLMLEITRAVVNSVKKPVTVKTRLGWDQSSQIIVDIAEQLQDAGVQALTIHGRTRAQLYSGEADWTLIGQVKNNPRMHIPIIGNGDITTPQKAREYFTRYNVDGIMIGRGAIGRPWIFREIRHYLNTGELLPPPTIEEHVEMIRQYLRTNVANIGERAGILHTRRHLAVTFKSLPHFRQTKITMLRSNTLEEIEVILDDIKKEYAGFTNATPHSNDAQ
jgi:nifR3 family TIM-barrel protein